MKITLACDCKIPASLYDDKARVLWWLGKELARLGHEVSYLVQDGSSCHFAKVLVFNSKLPVEPQIPADADLVHFHDEPDGEISKPYLITQHDNSLKPRSFDPNTVFVSNSQAKMHGGSVFVYHGIDFTEYSKPDLGAKKLWFHFLGNAMKKGRNLHGAIDLASRADARLHVIGISRVNFRQGFNVLLSTTARFHGTLSSDGRDALLNASRGMIFPVLWHEPFCIGVIESLYFGCPVFGTPFGAMPELLGKKITSKQPSVPVNGTVDAFYSDHGCLSDKKSELLEALKNAGDYDQEQSHEYAEKNFSSARMAQDYLLLYEKVLNNKPVHTHAPVMEEAPNEKALSIK